MKTKLFLGVLALMCVAAAPVANIMPFQTAGGRRNLLNVACTASSTLRTVTETVAGYSKLLVYTALTDADSSVSAVTTTCTTSIDGSSFGSLTSVSVSAGAATVTPLVFSRTTSGTSQWMREIDVWGYSAIKCVFACTNGAAGDKLVVQMQAAVGK